MSLANTPFNYHNPCTTLPGPSGGLSRLIVLAQYSILLLCLLLAPVPAHAQRPITGAPFAKGNNLSSNPTGFTALNGKVLFIAETIDQGYELWVSEGEDARLLVDIYAGPNPGFEDYVAPFGESPIIKEGYLYFIARDREAGKQMYRTDGTTAGTIRLTNVPGGRVDELTLIGETFFIINKRGTQSDLWKSDGTPFAEELLISINSNNGLQSLGAVGDQFAFVRRKVDRFRQEVWLSDGTPQNTRKLQNSRGEEVIYSRDDFSQQVNYKGALYFFGYDERRTGSETAHGLFKLDAEADTVSLLIAMIDPGNFSSGYQDALVIGDTLYFSHHSRDHQRLLIWKSDGTTAGTELIYDRHSPLDFISSNLNVYQEQLLFVGVDTANRSSVQLMDLQTYEVTDRTSLRPGTSIIVTSGYKRFPVRMETLTDSSYLIRYENKFNRDETALLQLLPDTTRLQNFTELDHALTGSDFFYSPSFRASVQVSNEQLYFRNQSASGMEPWVASLDLSATRQLQDINRAGVSLGFSNGNARLPVATFSKGIIYGRNQPYFIDLQSGEETLINAAGTSPTALTTFADEVYYYGKQSGPPGSSTEHLYKTDGTRSGTVSLYEEAISMPFSGSMIPFKDRLYFTGYPTGNLTLLVTDGDTVERVRGFPLVSSTSANQGLVDLEITSDRFYFAINRGTEELWSSDGTAEGTISLGRFNTISDTRVVQGLLYFTVEGSFGDNGLWVTNGTPEGTRQVIAFTVDSPKNLLYLTEYQGQLVFSAFTKDLGQELWTTDGTTAGTKIVFDLFEGPSSAINDDYEAIPERLRESQFLNYDYFVESGGWLYFQANNGVTGYELYKTNLDTVVLAADLAAGPADALPKNLYSHQDVLYFNAFDMQGEELWTLASTGQLSHYDLISGHRSSYPSDFFSVGDQVYFMADTDSSGFQIWAAALPNLIAPVINSVPLLEVLEDERYQYPITASDGSPDDSLSYALQQGPDWLSLQQDSTGVPVLTGTPSNEDVGTHEVTLVVTDLGGNRVMQQFVLTVINVNDPPVISSIPTTIVEEDAQYEYTLRASDVDTGDQLRLITIELPDWLSLTAQGDSAWSLLGTPRNEAVGEAVVQLRVEDVAGASADQSFTIRVTNTNDAPEISSSPVETVLEDEHYEYVVRVEDVDEGDELTITTPTLPSWLRLTTLNATSARLEGIPTVQDIGEFELTIEVTDRSMVTATQSFTLTVVSVNDAPTIADQQFSISEDDLAGSLVGTLLAEDEEQDVLSFRIESGNDGAFALEPRTGQLTLVDPALLDATSTPEYQLQVSVSDGELTTEARVSIKVEPSVINSLPSAASLQIEYYPNPSTGRVLLRSQRFSGAEVQLLLTSTLGRVHQVNLQRQSASLMLFDMSHLAAGTYSGILTINGEQSILKLLKD